MKYLLLLFIIWGTLGFFVFMNFGIWWDDIKKTHKRILYFIIIGPIACIISLMVNVVEKIGKGIKNLSTRIDSIRDWFEN